MTDIDSTPENATSPPRRGSALLRKWAVIVASMTGGFLLVGVGYAWLELAAPRWLFLRVAIVFLWFLLGAFSLGLPAAMIGTVWSSLTLTRARRRLDREGKVRAMRWVLLASSCLASLIVVEVVAWIMVERSYRIPEPRTRFANPPDRSVLKIVVLGESSARGDPYQPWVSVGQIVGWQMERVIPGRKVDVDVRAWGGVSLEEALLPLTELERKPDAVILFSGHNEFQSRYGWSRNVRYYLEEGPESLLGLQELGRTISSTTYLILQNLDRFYGEAPPPYVTRELVDHPSFTVREYAYRRRDFQRRLDSLAAYCNRIGALAILIVPGSNDGSYEPTRSVLAPATKVADRAEFAAAFQAARAAETSDPAQAIAIYWRLASQHPEFAESHYRLAKMLASAGDWNEAAKQFVLARDHDALPMRCPSDFREVFPAVARLYGSVLVDGPSILATLSPHAILDDHLYHDAQHLNLVGAIALAQDVLEQLRARRAFGWPESTPVPQIELDECARHFELDSQKWVQVCERTADMYAKLASVRYDPTDRLDVHRRYERAAKAIAAGRPLGANSPLSLAPMRSILENLRTERN